MLLDEPEAIVDVILKIAAIGMFTGGMLLAPDARATPSFDMVLGNGGVATASFIGFSAADTDTLGVVGGLSPVFVNNATAVGTTISLGVFASGAEIEFTIVDSSFPATFFSGPGSRNPDGQGHANVTTNIADIPGLSAESYAFAATLPAGTMFVGFEDRAGSASDFDYNDLVFAIQNATPADSSAAPAVVPEPASFAVLGAGLAGLRMVRRRTRVA